MRTICAPAQRSLSRLLTEIRHIRCALGIDPDLSLFYNFVGLTPGSHSVCILGVNFGPSLLRQHDTLLCHSFFLLGGQWPTTHTHEMWDLRHMAYLFGDLSRRHGTATLSLALWDLVRLLLVILRTATDVGWLGCALGCASTRGDFTVVYWGTGVGRGKRQGTGRGRVWARKATQCGAGRIPDFLLAGLAGTLSAVGELTRVHNMPCY